MEEQNYNKSSVVTRMQTFFSLLKYVNFESSAARVFLGVVFLLPLFVLPYGMFPVDFSKAMLAYLGVSVVALLLLASRIKKESVVLPRSYVFFGLFIVSVVAFLSAVFSDNLKLSLIGAGYETGTFSAFFLLVVISFIVPVLFRTANHLALLYKTIFFSAIVLFVIQTLYTAVGLPIPPFEMFSGRLDSVLGSWSDLGIFFGLVALLALSTIELKGAGRKAKTFLWVVLGVSLLVVFFVNFLPLYYVLGVFVFVLLIDRLVELSRGDGYSTSSKKIFQDPSFFVFLVIFLCTVSHQWIGIMVNYLGLQFTQVSPSWGATYEVIKSTLSSNPFFGSGPNTFSYDWFNFRPDAISATAFWGTKFLSGVGRIPSMIAETGFAGAISLFVFFFALLATGGKIISYKEHNIERMLLWSSFLATIYLWVFMIIYSPGFLLVVFTGIFMGIFVAALGLTKERSFIEIRLGRTSKKGLLTYAILVAVMLFTVFTIYIFGSKYLASYYYKTAIHSATVLGNIDRAGINLERAISLDPQDVYFRGASEIGLMVLGQIISQSENKESISEEEKNQFRGVLEFTIQSASGATVVNPRDPENWLQLGKVYENLLQLDAKGYKEHAVSSYREAAKVSPKSPVSLVALARVEAMTGNLNGALSYLSEGLKIKSDYAPAHMLVADIALSQNNIKGAIEGLDYVITSNPNNPDNIYYIMRIGALYYQAGEIDKSQTVFENLVGANPNYVDARYALALVYDKKGMTSKAIEQFEAISLLVPENTQIKEILNSLRSGKSAL